MNVTKYFEPPSHYSQNVHIRICTEDFIDLSGVNQVFLPTQDTMISHFRYNKNVRHSFR